MALIRPRLPQRPVIRKEVTIRSTIGRRHAPVKEVTKSTRIGNKTIITTKSSRTTGQGLVQRASSQRIIVKAKHGYHGIVTKPTRFLVGEDGAEHVRITPLKKTRHNMLDYGSGYKDFDFGGGLF